MALKAKDSHVGSNPRWKSISEAVHRLFELKRYPELAQNLTTLNDNVSVLSKSDLGPFISDYYQDHILTPCMGKLLVEVSKERDGDLINKMGEIWIQFYTAILPTLSAIFATVQPQHNKLSVRSLTLINFRDLVVLKTKLSAAVQRYRMPLPPEIEQMLLVLQSVHRTPPDDRFFLLQDIVGAVVDSYLPMVMRSSQWSPRSVVQGQDSRNTRAVTMDMCLDSEPSSLSRSDRGERTSISPETVHSLERRHSVGLLDTESPVTRL